MLRPELDDPCTCRLCVWCRHGLHSGCRDTPCTNANRRHACACTEPGCVARRTPERKNL